MTIMHVFSIAEGGPNTPGAQFREHHSIPWDEAYEYYLDLDRLQALVKLARAAQGGTEGLKGRVFDVLRCVSNAQPQGDFARRDHGPYALVTDSSVWTRIELENHMGSLTAQEWQRAYDTGQLILRLVRGITSK